MNKYHEHIIIWKNALINMISASHTKTFINCRILLSGRFYFNLLHISIFRIWFVWFQWTCLNFFLNFKCFFFCCFVVLFFFKLIGIQLATKSFVFLVKKYHKSFFMRILKNIFVLFFLLLTLTHSLQVFLIDSKDNLTETPINFNRYYYYYYY